MSDTFFPIKKTIRLHRNQEKMVEELLSKFPLDYDTESSVWRAGLMKLYAERIAKPTLHDAPTRYQQ